MNPHETIEIGASLWWKMLSGTVTAISLLVLIGKKYPKARNGIRIISGWMLVALSLALPMYLIYFGAWSIRTSLPLQLCGLSGILSGIVLLWRNQLAYELLLYWGIPGALYALLTPELTQGSGTLFIIEYYISHGGIIFSVLYLTLVYHLYPRKHSWLNVFLITQFLLLAVGLVDYFLDANYMYLRDKPLVGNPFLIGDWPWYIFMLELAGFVHFYLLYLFFQSPKTHVQKQILK